MAKIKCYYLDFYIQYSQCLGREYLKMNGKHNHSIEKERLMLIIVFVLSNEITPIYEKFFSER